MQHLSQKSLLLARKSKLDCELSGNTKLKALTMNEFHVTYSTGPRYIDGVNIDVDANASIAKTEEVAISDPVTGLKGLGYEPGQKNKDGSDL